MSKGLTVNTERSDEGIFPARSKQGNFEQEVTELTEARDFDLAECVACSRQQILNRSKQRGTEVRVRPFDLMLNYASQGSNGLA
jgi:hypothetical protein